MAASDIARRDRIAATVLVTLVIALGGLLLARRTLLDDAVRRDAEPDPRLQRDAVLFDRFAARRTRRAAPPPRAANPPPRLRGVAVLSARFAARRERSEDEERLSLSLRLR